jgi:hypothetical protein
VVSSIEIRLSSGEHSGAALKELLTSELPNAPGVTLEIRKEPVRVRGVDGSVLVAVVGSAGAALGALVAGLLRVATGTRSRTILIESRDGRKLQYPADLPPEKVRELLAIIAELDAPTIRV